MSLKRLCDIRGWGVACPALRTCVVIADFSARCHLAPSADVCAGMCAPELQKELRGVIIGLRCASALLHTPFITSPLGVTSMGCVLVGAGGPRGVPVQLFVTGSEGMNRSGVRVSGARSDLR